MNSSPEKDYFLKGKEMNETGPFQRLFHLLLNIKPFA